MKTKSGRVLLALVFSLCLVSPSEAQLTKLSAAYSAESSWSLATWVAYEGGLFKKYGLDVDLVYIQGSPILTAAMVSGQVPLSFLGGADIVASAVGGADTVYLVRHE